jgi:hypothetical protein
MTCWGRTPIASVFVKPWAHAVGQGYYYLFDFVDICMNSKIHLRSVQISLCEHFVECWLMLKDIDSDLTFIIFLPNLKY